MFTFKGGFIFRLQVVHFKTQAHYNFTSNSWSFYNQVVTTCWSSSCVVATAGFLTVCIEEGEHFPLSYTGPQQPGCDETLSLRLPDHADDLQLQDELLQLTLQVLCGHRTSSGEGHRRLRRDRMFSRLQNYGICETSHRRQEEKSQTNVARGEQEVETLPVKLGHTFPPRTATKGTYFS